MSVTPHIASPSPIYPSPDKSLNYSANTPFVDDFSFLQYEETTESESEGDDSPPIHQACNDLFGIHGTMNVRGRGITPEEANKTAKKTTKRFRLTIAQLHQAQLFHGSTSASLLAFTDYNKRQGALLPQDALEKLKVVPFCGENAFGCLPKAVNRTNISTTWIGEFDAALTYTIQSRWTPTKSHTEIEKFKQRMDENPQCPISPVRFNLETQRQQSWEKLSLIEQDLVSNSFPVLYGIRSDRKNVHHLVKSDVAGEIALEGGANPDEIKVIFVPPDKASLINQVLASHGHSIPVEPLNALMDLHTPNDLLDLNSPTAS